MLYKVIKKSSFSYILFIMTTDQLIQKANDSLSTAVDKTFNFHTITVFVLALVLAYLISQILSFIIIRLARTIGHYGDIAKTPERALRLRRLETYLSVTVALLRTFIFFVALIAAWQYTYRTTGAVTIIGASTVFIVLAGATIQPLLRDVTTGSLMIAEQWFNVGDFITLDPFTGDAGVVERMNLRSTRIRKINGEILWIHNQYIQHVSVSPKGIRTVALDLFVNDLAKGKELVGFLKSTLTVGPTMLVKPLELSYTQKLTEHMWQITVVGQTAPGREWLMEKFAIDITKENDQDMNGDKPVLVYEPLARYADPEAERRFKRAVRLQKTKQKTPSKLAGLALNAQTHFHKRSQPPQKK